MASKRARTAWTLVLTLRGKSRRDPEESRPEFFLEGAGVGLSAACVRRRCRACSSGSAATACRTRASRSRRRRGRGVRGLSAGASGIFPSISLHCERLTSRSEPPSPAPTPTLNISLSLRARGTSPRAARNRRLPVASVREGARERGCKGPGRGRSRARGRGGAGARGRGGAASGPQGRLPRLAGPGVWSQLFPPGSSLRGTSFVGVTRQPRAQL